MIKQIFTPFFIGVGAFVITFVVMQNLPPIGTSIVTILLYFIAGLWIGKLQPNSIWYAPIIMNIIIWLVFIPMGMEIWPPFIHIWYFLIPPIVALPSAYIGMYVGSRGFARRKPNPR